MKVVLIFQQDYITKKQKCYNFVVVLQYNLVIIMVIYHIYKSTFCKKNRPYCKHKVNYHQQK